MSDIAPIQEEDTNPEIIIGKYKQMMSECQQYATKMNDLSFDKDEHRLVLDKLTKLESERKAFRLVGGVLVERTVGEVLPFVTENHDQIKNLIEILDQQLKTKDAERRAYKQKHGIYTQEEREQMAKQQKAAQQGAKQ